MYRQAFTHIHADHPYVLRGRLTVPTPHWNQKGHTQWYALFN